IDPATGGTYGSAVAAANGAWSYPVTTNYNKLYEFQAYSIDRAGNRSATSSKFGITVDTVNAAPVITSVTDNVGPVTGNVANAGSTDDNTPTLNGTAEAGSTVYIAVNGSTYSVTAAANGSWSLTPSALPLGNHTFSVFSIDKAGNQSAGVSRSLSVVSPTVTEDFEWAVGQQVGIPQGTALKSGLVISCSYGGYAYQPYVGGGHHALMRADRAAPVRLTWGTGKYVGSVEMDLVTPAANIAYAPVTVVFYDKSGAVLSTQTYTSARHISFSAPAGKEIAAVDMYTGTRGGSLAFDNVSWTPKASGVMGMMSMGEDVHDDSTSIASLDSHQTHSVLDKNTLTLTDNEKPLDFSKLVTKTDVVNQIDMVNGKADTLNIGINDVLTHAKTNLFVDDGAKQLMVKGEKGDVLNLNDLLPDNSDPGNWTNAGNVKVSGVEYQVYHMESQDVELLVQAGVTVNVNNH
ncbi:Ig-like domain-containing protein, partial [Enterobacter ludwigii]